MAAIEIVVGIQLRPRLLIGRQTVIESPVVATGNSTQSAASMFTAVTAARRRFGSIETVKCM
ncbi:hypothetical protein BJF84_08360 [Rhodococcus sp. CUA-806]|nr:hypothetical protein BJF84_08360 [Rhodococcus sp. CUA-806]